MTKRRYLLGCVFGCFLLALTGLMAQTLQVVNGEGHSATITAAQIAALPHRTVNVRDHDKDAQFEGVPLGTVLSMTGIRLGDSLRGPRMIEMLLVQAGDGYKVVFALAELDLAFATKEIILADKRDGKPLDAKDVIEWVCARQPLQVLGTELLDAGGQLLLGAASADYGEVLGREQAGRKQRAAEGR